MRTRIMVNHVWFLDRLADWANGDADSNPPRWGHPIHGQRGTRLAVLDPVLDVSRSFAEADVKSRLCWLPPSR